MNSLKKNLNNLKWLIYIKSYKHLIKNLNKLNHSLIKWLILDLIWKIDYSYLLKNNINKIIIIKNIKEKPISW